APDSARPELPRRTRRALALAGDLLRAGLPRADDGNARSDRAAGVARTVRALPAPAPAHPAQHVAFGPDRSGGPRCARPRPRTGGTRDRLGVLLRSDQRRGAARVDAVSWLLGGPGRTPRPPRGPRLLRAGGPRGAATGRGV